VKKGLIGEVIGRFEKAGLKIAAMKMIHMSKKEAEVSTPSTGEAVLRQPDGLHVLGALRGPDPGGEKAISRNRELMGATNRRTPPGTIRKVFAANVEQNIVHGSDAPETAAFEMGYFFNALEICS